MKLQTGAFVALCLFTQTAVAQESPHPVRQIAPERFQPNPRDDAQPTSATATVTPPTKEHPLGSCDRAAHGWLNCLRATADVSTLLVSGAESEAVASLDRREYLSAPLHRVLAKALADADAKWLELRDLECNQLALLEVGQGAPLYEAQLICRINHNLERIDQLTAHYRAKET